MTLKIWQLEAKENYCNFASFNRVVDTKTLSIMSAHHFDNNFMFCLYSAYFYEWFLFQTFTIINIIDESFGISENVQIEVGWSILHHLKTGDDSQINQKSCTTLFLLFFMIK